MSTDIKLSKVQLSKAIQSGGFWGAFLGKFGVPLMQVAVLFAKNVFVILTAMALASAINGAIDKKINRRDVVKTGKGIALVISNEDLNGITRIIKLLEICWLKKESSGQENDVILLSIWIKVFSSTLSFKQHRDYWVFQLRI